MTVLTETDEWRRAARFAAAEEVSEDLERQRRESAAKAKRKK